VLTVTAGAAPPVAAKFGGGCGEGLIVGKFYARSSGRTVGKTYNNRAAAAIGIAVSY
jgi:hypothetical protein